MPMTTNEALAKINAKLKVIDRVPAGIGSDGEWGFDVNAVRALVAGYGEVRLVLYKLCNGRICTDDQKCPLGSYFDCSVPEMLTGLESGQASSGEVR